MRGQSCFPTLLVLSALLGANATATGESEPAAADGWLTHAPPAFLQPTNPFPLLKAEILVGQLKIYCPGSSNEVLRLVSSDEPPGHWTARDWRTNAMRFRGGKWEAILPVEDLDSPMIYRVESESRRSDLRLCHPRALGLPGPTQAFWPFLDGFEEGVAAWKVLAPSRAGWPVSSTNGHTGFKSMRLQIPTGKTSLAVGTARVRGWKAAQRRARGVALWVQPLRTSENVRVRLSLRSDGFSAQEKRFEGGWVVLKPGWQVLELGFGTFAGLVISEVDWLDLEITGPSEAEILVDDLQLTGFFGKSGGL